jgi:hypothetical protein
MFYHWSLHLIWSMLWAWSEICDFCFLILCFTMFLWCLFVLGFLVVLFLFVFIFGQIHVHMPWESLNWANESKGFVKIVFWFCLILMVFQWRFRCLSMSSWWWDWWVIELCLIGYEWIPEEKLDQSRFRAWLLLLGLNDYIDFLIVICVLHCFQIMGAFW